MNQNNDPAIKHKLGLLELADQLSNVSRACKLMGVSRETFYRVRDAYDDGGGVEALLTKSRKVPNPKNRVEEHVEQAVCKVAIDNPALGQQRVINELRKAGIFVSPGGVRSIWQRHDLETFKKRLNALEAHVAETGDVLTESQLTALENLYLTLKNKISHTPRQSQTQKNTNNHPSSQQTTQIAHSRKQKTD